MNKRSNRIWLGLTALSLGAILWGCSTTQQITAYNTIGTMETLASGIVDGYFSAVAHGMVSTNYVPTVAKAFNAFQVSATLAANVAQAGTNALTTAELQSDFASLTNLVALATKGQ